MDVRFNYAEPLPPISITLTLSRSELMALTGACRSNREYEIDKLSRELEAACKALGAEPVNYVGAPPAAHKD
jgi:hypothetical protein